MVLTCRSLLLALFLAVIPTALASTTWYADGVNGNDGNDCKSSTTACKTIGHAISLASSGDSVFVAAATYTENLTISISLKLIGASAATTIIDGGAVNTVVTISSATASVFLSKFTIRNGKKGNSFVGGGGGIFNDGGTLTVTNSIVTGNSVSAGYFAANGGGVYNSGTLTISNSTLSENRVWGSGTVRASANGGGIYNVGTLTINNSTLSSNSAISSDSYGGAPSEGGGIYLGGPTTINDSTLSGNNAGGRQAGYGGGIYNVGGTLTISSSTLSGNTANILGGGIFGAATLQNSIVANSPVSGDCFGTVTSNGYNLSSDGTCNFSGPGDLNKTDPMLGPLQNNGGPTQTQALLSGSPAIDAGNPNGCTDGSGHVLKTDQRGAPRPDKEDTGGCDMGAYEKQTD